MNKKMILSLIAVCVLCSGAFAQASPGLSTDEAAIALTNTLERETQKGNKAQASLKQIVRNTINKGTKTSFAFTVYTYSIPVPLYGAGAGSSVEEQEASYTTTGYVYNDGQKWHYVLLRSNWEAMYNAICPSGFNRNTFGRHIRRMEFKTGNGRVVWHEGNNLMGHEHVTVDNVEYTVIK